uniref:FERM domain-containing protein n=1 Tax=Neogobius melanostomus TaxID=47308 RepID=A0A8C6T7X7_9GOBI
MNSYVPAVKGNTENIQTLRHNYHRKLVDAINSLLFCSQGPKSSFITPEKKAKLKCHPVKVRFAEEVEVNGQSQGNSLLFLPNVLKVYLENGQTKAFKFEPSTTVKDIVMTLKEKLSLIRIEHFSLVLEQQPGVTKILQLHEDERIQQVVQKKEQHDYRCLFRACFIPKELHVLLEEDPTAFEYLFLQGVNDVLQERFAVEMKCNTALRLAALHIQERLTWGIDSFVSSTLLRNMKEKDLKKAINYHLKKSLSLQDPKLKFSSVDQARINYLEELCDLKSFGGKPFSATLMLQDRESTVNLLVGARYGVSQVVNRKLSIMTALTDFTSITRIELLPESDRVSLVKIYVQDIKPITLLLETAAAKDMSCLIAGYCRVFIDPNISVFPWTDENKKHKISAEEETGSVAMGEQLKRQDDKPLPSSPASHTDYVFNFEQNDARCYYNLVSNITPDSARSLSQRGSGRGSEGDSAQEKIPILQPPPGFGDSSSEEEFYDARDQFGSPEDPNLAASPRDAAKRPGEMHDQQLGFRAGGERLSQLRKRSRKRRSYLETDYTATVSFPEPNEGGGKRRHPNPEPEPTVSSLTHSEGEPSQLESKPILSKQCSKESLKLRTSDPQNITRKQDMEMEPDAMESKSVTDLMKPPSPNITVVRCRVDPDGKESADRTGDGKEESIEETKSILSNGPFDSHMFLRGISENTADIVAENVKVETTNNLTLSLTKDLASPSLAKQEVSLNSPSQFMFQAWSPGIMGRLSASTLRSKIQSLPFYLSRSVEAVNQAGVASPTQSPAEELSQDKEITISVTDVNNVTETLDLAVESDESDSTVTGSDLDQAPSEETNDEKPEHNIEAAKSSSHCEPEDQKQPALDQTMPGPVIEPPTSIVNQFQQTQISYTDTPGPVTTAPQRESKRVTQPGEDVPGIKQWTSVERSWSSPHHICPCLLPDNFFWIQPSFPRSVLSSNASELSPLLSPLSDDCPQSHSRKETLQRLVKQQYPGPPSGFKLLRADVDMVLTVLESTHSEQSTESQRGLHPRDTCPAHFTENKRVLQIEARRLMTGCHQVVGIAQSSEEMFCSLVECFHILVGLSSLVLWFSSCERCERRNTEAVSGLVDVTRSFGDFCVAAERASSKRSCQDLSTKLLAKQCTALNASVFCLTQLFRTLTAL